MICTPVPHLLLENHGKRESYSSPQTSPPHYQLLPFGRRNQFVVIIRGDAGTHVNILYLVLISPQTYLLKSFQVDKSREEGGGEEPEDDAEQDGGDDEARMPVVLLRQDAHPQEEEDDTVAGGGQRLDRVLHRCEAFLADVLESIMLGCHSKADDADNPRPNKNKHIF